MVKYLIIWQMSAGQTIAWDGHKLTWVGTYNHICCLQKEYYGNIVHRDRTGYGG